MRSSLPSQGYIFSDVGRSVQGCTVCAHRIGDLHTRFGINLILRACSFLIHTTQISTFMHFQITYAATGNDLNVPIIFSSLQLFNVIRAPLSFLPTALSSLSDVVVALRRISDFLSAEELVESLLIDQEAKNGVEAEGAFTWETIKVFINIRIRI